MTPSFRQVSRAPHDSARAGFWRKVVSGFVAWADRMQDGWVGDVIGGVALAVFVAGLVFCVWGFQS
ncbi:hypothetical protein RGUI_0805 [Rhodovulum sp. P5]|uniref:hypothetical protein n=1 Tax=Rhodovulum phage vB_RhkS_P1 TaxID=1873452 RepID=UPI00080AAEB8|nr:hypothetical protein [Rhodovulum sp. P5]YP_009285890.1 hypothetical protein BI026_gp05 [Rhodovulum phage vB_RhkS_P1]ANT39876.1 hypothetical protein Rhks_5 [Rhodovulum phage vB_RhkS_P1]ARE38946.1 hypothetical protein RGUI_0805 [Rhodovulum sp. P5]